MIIVKNIHWEMISVVKPINTFTLYVVTILCVLGTLRASHVAQLIKNMPAMWDTWVRFLGWEDPLEKERLPTPIFWLGEFHGLYSQWGCNDLATFTGLIHSYDHGWYKNI